MNEPLITDWINSIAALIGVPLVIGGIIKLFLKNKSQERKLNSLENLAKSQNDVVLKMTEQIQELSRQTSEFQYQTFTIELFYEDIDGNKYKQQLSKSNSYRITNPEPIEE